MSDDRKRREQQLEQQLEPVEQEEMLEQLKLLKQRNRVAALEQQINTEISDEEAERSHAVYESFSTQLAQTLGSAWGACDQITHPVIRQVTEFYICRGLISAVLNRQPLICEEEGLKKLIAEGRKVYESYREKAGGVDFSPENLIMVREKPDLDAVDTVNGEADVQDVFGKVAEILAPFGSTPRGGEPEGGN